MVQGKKRILLRLAALFLATGMLSFAGFYVYVLWHPDPPCAQPCRDIGTEFDPAELARGFKEIRPKCSPIELSFQLAEPKTRTGTWYTLWYRIGIKNVCCGRIFEFGRPAYGLNFRIWGPDGKLIRPREGDAPIAFGVLAYDTETPIAGEKRPDLLPGETVFTKSSILHPHSVETGEHGPDPTLEEEFPGEKFRNLREGLQKIRDERFAEELKKIQPLSEGFPGYRVLEHYSFDKPGRYKIQAVYERNELIIPPYPWYWDLSFPLRDIASEILDAHGRWSLPDSQRVQLRAESKILEFEVEPWRP